MIDLLLEVYNYLIKPRLQNLKGHRVSLKEKKKGERKKSHTLQMTECISPLGVPTMSLWLLQNLWVIFSACCVTRYLSSPAENKLPTIFFYVLMDVRSIISISFHGKKKIYRSEQETTHLMNYFYTTAHAHTSTTSPFAPANRHAHSYNRSFF